MIRIKRFVIAITVALSATACARDNGIEVPTGSEVAVQRQDGVEVRGRLIEVQAEQVVLEAPGGQRVVVPRGDIRKITAAKAATPAAAPREIPATEAAAVGTTGTPGTPLETPAAAPRARERAPEYQEVTIPAGTMLPVSLQSVVASNTSNVEDPVRATLRRPVVIGGVRALPAGTVVLGHVTSARESARVKGRASVGLRFNELDVPGDAGRVRFSSATISRVAAGTKKKDAAKIGAGAGAGAIIGGLLGGGDGAAKGAAIGGAAGTGVVLSTRGQEVKLGPGTPLSVRLTNPLTVRVARK